MKHRRSTFAPHSNPSTDVEAVVTPPAEPDIGIPRRVLLTVMLITAVAIVALGILVLHAAVTR